VKYSEFVITEQSLGSRDSSKIFPFSPVSSLDERFYSRKNLRSMADDLFSLLSPFKEFHVE